MHSIKLKILTIELVFLAFLGTAFVFYSMITTVNYKHLRLDGIEKTVVSEAENVNKTIAAIERSAIFLSIDAMLYYTSQSIESSEPLLLEYLRSFPTINGGGYWFEPYAHNESSLRGGIFVYFDSQKGVMSLNNTYLTEEYDYHNQAWYRQIIDTVKKPYQVAWTKPYIDEIGSYAFMTTAGAGIFDQDGSLIGISTIDWEIAEVVDELSQIKPTKNSYVLLSAPEQDYIITNTNIQWLSRRGRAGTGGSLKSLPWDTNASSFTLEGLKYLQFNRILDNGWLLSVQIPENEIFSEIETRNSHFSILIALSSLIILALVYILTSKLINEPIKLLTQDVAQLALGNLDIHIDVKTKDELGLLAETFNKMTSDLKASIEAYTREHAEKERIGAELSIAAEIQAHMLPCIFPPFPDRAEFELFASMLPAKEVGGDFYDFYLVDKDNLALVIADVSGKGIPAALFMVITKTLIKNCSFCKSPRNVLETVNNKLCVNNDSNMFVTAFMGFYNIPTGRFVYVSAGHNPPLVKKREKDYVFLETEPCFFLGGFENTIYKEKEIYLGPGDTLYLYTDGVTEAMDAEREFYSEQRLLETINKNKNLKPRELLSAIKLDIDDFTGNTDQADDITMLAMQVDHLTEPTEAVMKELKVEASIDSLNDVMDFVNMELERINCNPELQNQINLVVEEIFMNIAHYAYIPEKGDAIISIRAGKNVLIKIEDTGRLFNPLERPAPDLDNLLEKGEIGGLGIFLVRKLMDKVTYSRMDNKNILVMTKQIY